MTTSALTIPVRRVTHDTKLAVARIFQATAHPAHDFDDDFDELLAKGMPSSKDLVARASRLGLLVHAAQHAVGSLVTSHLSRKMGIVAPIPLGDNITRRENGIPKSLVYQRPYRVAALAYQGGASQDEAMTLGLRRLNSITGVDIQMAKVRQAQIVLKAGGRKTFHRVPTSGKPCDLCELAADQTYYTEDLMPIHDSCACEIEPGEPDEDAQEANEAVDDNGTDEVPRDSDGDEDRKIAIREHGEIGPMLTWAHQNFQGPQDLPTPELAFKANGDPLTGRHGRSLTVDEANERNNVENEGNRRRQADKLDADGVTDERRLNPRYAVGVNSGSRYARDDAEEDE